MSSIVILTMSFCMLYSRSESTTTHRVIVSDHLLPLAAVPAQPVARGLSIIEDSLVRIVHRKHNKGNMNGGVEGNFLQSRANTRAGAEKATVEDVVHAMLKAAAIPATIEREHCVAPNVELRVALDRHLHDGVGCAAFGGARDEGCRPRPT